MTTCMSFLLKHQTVVMLYGDSVAKSSSSEPALTAMLMTLPVKFKHMSIYTCNPLPNYIPNYEPLI